MATKALNRRASSALASIQSSTKLDPLRVERAAALASAANHQVGPVRLGRILLRETLANGEPPLIDTDLSEAAIHPAFFTVENLVLRGVVTALDNAAGAVKHVTPGTDSGQHEADVGWWFANRKQRKIDQFSVPKALDAWLRDLVADPTWVLLEDLRHRYTHRATPTNRTIGAVVAPVLGTAQGAIGLDVLVDLAIAFMDMQLDTFWTALEASA